MFVHEESRASACLSDVHAVSEKSLTLERKVDKSLISNISN